jgi:uroporphyrinogen decarboxylase
MHGCADLASLPTAADRSFSRPFQNSLLLQVIDSVKQTHPQLPIILYISGSGGLLERMAAANPDIISIDQSVDIVDGIKRVGSGFAIQVR